MKHLQIGNRAVPLWVVAVLLTSMIGIGVLADYVWRTLNIPLEVKEPIEILFYPSEFSIFPGETEEFNITVQNNASVSYLVALVFHLSNTTYQSKYVTFSYENYTVTPGKQHLTAWLMVESDAPPVNVSLTVEFKRLTTSFFATEEINIIFVRFYGDQDYINLSIYNTGTASITIIGIWVNSVRRWTGEINIQPGHTETVKVNVSWAEGNKYEFKIVSSHGNQFTYIAYSPTP